MNPRVYIETTLFSYLTAWRSPQLVMAAHQEATRQWRDDERLHFDLFVSEAVIEEAAAGDPDAAQKRLDVIQIKFPFRGVKTLKRNRSGPPFQATANIAALPFVRRLTKRKAAMSNS